MSKIYKDDSYTDIYIRREGALVIKSNQFLFDKKKSKYPQDY